MLPGCPGEVGCFGKLPLSPEFIRVNAKGATLEAFDQWIQEGLLWCRAKLGPQWRNDFLQSESWHFLFQIPQKNEWLIGVMTPSQDKAGRVFPMILFFRFQLTHSAQKFLPLAPLLLQEFLEKAKELIQEEWKAISLVEFREKVTQLLSMSVLKQEQGRELYHEFLKSYSLRNFLQACGVLTQSLTELEVQEMVKGMVKETRPSTPSPKGQLMSFPLVDEPALPFEVTFWMEYMSSITANSVITPLLLWNKCPSKGRAVLLTQDTPVTPKSFWSLIQSSHNLEAMWKMRTLDETQTLSGNDLLNHGSQSTGNSQDATLESLLLGQRM